MFGLGLIQPLNVTKVGIDQIAVKGGVKVDHYGYGNSCDYQSVSYEVGICLTQVGPTGCGFALAFASR